MANFLFVLRKDDNEVATKCFQCAKIAHLKDHKVNLPNMMLDGGPHLIDLAAEAKVFNF